ncbi:MAG: hypothetical protein OEV33_04660 [Armatimonadota bacterium]|nr:hypothetical protein [Armatimonadota bacterium]
MIHSTPASFILRPLLAALLVSLLAGEPTVGQRRGSRGPERHPPYPENECESPAPRPLPHPDEFRQQMLSVFETPVTLRVTLQIEGQYAVPILHQDRDRDAWNLLIAGIRNSQPGFPVPTAPRTLMVIWKRTPGGDATLFRPGFEAGMLGLYDRRLGGMIPTLEVGAEFLEGLHLLQQTTGVELPRGPALSFYPEVSPRQPQIDYDKLAQTSPVGREEALAIAKRFAAAFGLPLGDRPQITFQPENGAGAPAHWSIRNFDFSYLRIDTEHGWVTDVENRSGLFENAYKRPLPKLTPEHALARAQSIHRMMGIQADSVSPPTAVFEQNRDGIAASYRVTCKRLVGAIPFRDDGPVVLLDAETGHLLRVYRDFSYPIPDSTQVLVEASEAADTALQIARDISHSDDVEALRDPTLEVVRPNYLFTPDEERPPLDCCVTRVSWIVSFAVAGEEMEIWIDAANAEVLGGSLSHDLYDAMRARNGRVAPTRTRPHRPHQAPRQPRSFPLLFVAAGSVLVLIILGVLIHSCRASRR